MRTKMFYISKFCLLCLKEDDGSLVDVKNKDASGVTIQEKLDYCVFELISSGHEFPGFVCQECFGLLETLYVFKQKCFKSNRKIRNFMDSLKQMQFSALSYRDLSVPVQKLDNIISSPVKPKRNSIVLSPKKEIASSTIKKDSLLQFPKIDFFGCDLCKKQFSTKFLLSRHVKTHSKVKPYECGTCLIRFTRKDNLRFHEQHHCKSVKIFNSVSKKIKQVSMKTSKVNKGKIKLGKKTYQCGLCNTTIAHRANLKRHFLRFHVKSKEDFNLSYNVIEAPTPDMNLQSFADNDECSETDTASTLTSPEIDLESFDDDVILLDDIEQNEILHSTSNNLNVPKKKQNNKSPSNLTEKNLKLADDSNLKCFICQKTFTRKCKLSAHVGSHFDDASFKN